MKCGLLGRHLCHSYSPQIHKTLGDYDYRLFEIEPEDLSAFLTQKDFDGLNVTIPYKKAVIPFCSSLSPQAEAVGAVNTIIKTADGKLIGHNTDYFGFSYMLSHSGLTVTGKKVLILGSGGASTTVAAVLKEVQANAVIVSRTGENNYENLHLHADAAVIVNTTPVGMYPDNGHSPIDLTQFPKLEGVLDLIYNPARTALLLNAEKQGLVAMNGLCMLVAQAKESAEWFIKDTISDKVIGDIHSKLKSQMENIALIGMPGCGKSTIGMLLAEKTGRELIDVDALIVKRAGKSIPEICAESGENGFRALETEVLSEICMKSGLVIATGGGCVTRQENYPLLHQNSNIIWIKRDISLLPTDGRPLSQGQQLEIMYKDRAPLYEAFSDFAIMNDALPENAVNTILGGLI